MKKIINNISKIKINYENLRKRKILYLIIFLFFLIIPFFSLFMNDNLYVCVLDISPSMNDYIPSKSGENVTKIDGLKQAMIKLIDRKLEGDYCIITYGPGSKTSLDGILNSDLDSLGGSILVFPTDDKENIKSIIDNIYANTDSGTHFSEALHKGIKTLETSFYLYKDVKFLIFGDGEDHCSAIQPGDNVITRNNNITDKIKFYTILIPQYGDNGLRNFSTIAEDGKGKLVEIEYVENFYDTLSQIIRNDLIIIIHIVLSFLIFMIAFIIFIK